MTIEPLLAALGFGFEHSLDRFTQFHRWRGQPRAEARAFYQAALVHPEVPFFVLKEIATELEFVELVELLPELRARSASEPGLGFGIAVLEALAAGDCSCSVYRARSAPQSGPHMEGLGAGPAPHPQVEVQRYYCTRCGARLEHRREHHERGPTLDRWALLHSGEGD